MSDLIDKIMVSRNVDTSGNVSYRVTVFDQMYDYDQCATLSLSEIEELRNQLSDILSEQFGSPDQSAAGIRAIQLFPAPSTIEVQRPVGMSTPAMPSSVDPDPLFETRLQAPLAVQQRTRSWINLNALSVERRAELGISFPNYTSGYGPRFVEPDVGMRVMSLVTEHDVVAGAVYDVREDIDAGTYYFLDSVGKWAVSIVDGVGDDYSLHEDEFIVVEPAATMEVHTVSTDQEETVPEEAVTEEAARTHSYRNYSALTDEEKRELGLLGPWFTSGHVPLYVDVAEGGYVMSLVEGADMRRGGVYEVIDVPSIEYGIDVRDDVGDAHSIGAGHYIVVTGNVDEQTSSDTHTHEVGEQYRALSAIGEFPRLAEEDAAQIRTIGPLLNQEQRDEVRDMFFSYMRIVVNHTMINGGRWIDGIDDAEEEARG